MHIRTQILLSRFAHIFRRYFRTGKAEIYQLFRLPKFLSFSISCHVSQPIPLFFHKSPFPDPSCTFPDPFTTPFHGNFPLHFLTIQTNFWLKYGYFSRLVWEWGIWKMFSLPCHTLMHDKALRGAIYG